MNPKSITVQPVVMAGGSGTRLWPLSRAGYPKQFLALAGGTSLFQQAVARLQSLAGQGLTVAAPMVVGNDEHRFLVLDQLRELAGAEPSAVLLEPTGRNTAPALTLAALQALEGGQDPVLVVTPSDHTIADEPAFHAAMAAAVALAAEGAIAILGIRPSGPETGFGYIRARPGSGVPGAPEVERFVEKPDLATAERYLAEGGYSWNAGMFVLKASVWMAALERFRPDIAAATRDAFAARGTDAKFVRPDQALFGAVPSESIDYAVIEKCPGSGIPLHVIELDAGWNDLGAWEAVWQVSPKDADGNATVGDAIVTDSHNTLVHASSRLVAAVGLDDVVVVETADAVLVASRERSQDVKKIVARLGAEQRACAGGTR